jgi:hypothetical protein
MIITTDDYLTGWRVRSNIKVGRGDFPPEPEAE